ncbi:MAG: hypothetical protein JWO42_3209, partial [Chloroflexi bacterium]|nr:hypothetical protein [Chloroflexota bacterium]
MTLRAAPRPRLSNSLRPTARFEGARNASAPPLRVVAISADDATPGARWPIVCVLALTLIAALAVRLILLLRYYVTPDADQTIVGLMARHILQGERPLFYWGQPYTGSAEAYATAALFRIFGQSDLLLHIVPLVASLLFVALTVYLAWRLYGLLVAALSGIFFVSAPMLLVDWGFWAGSGYLEAMALGTAALLMVLPLGMSESRNAWLRVTGASFLLGFAVWVQPIAVYYLIAVLAVLIAPVLRLARNPRAWPAGLAALVLACGAFAVGAAPLLIFNLQHHGATFGFLAGRATHLGIVTVCGRLLLWACPVLLGFLPPTTDRTYFLGFIQGHIALYGMALLLVFVLLFRALTLWRGAASRLRSLLTGHPAKDAWLVLFILIVTVGYIGTGWGAEQWAGSQPRYLLPAYTALPLL